MLGKVVAENQRDWDVHVPHVVAAYRATIHESTGYSPNYLFLGRENRAPLDIVMGSPTPSDIRPSSANDYVDKRSREMEIAFQLVRTHLKRAAKRQKHYYDMRVRETVFKIGDRVWYFYPPPTLRQICQVAEILYRPIHCTGKSWSGELSNSEK